MKDGFIKIACATPELKVADCDYNADKITELIKDAFQKGVKVICFPELSITGYTCGDLFLQSALLNSAEENLLRIVNETAEMEINFLEITKDIIKSAIIGVEGTSKDTNYDLIESKADVEDGDYLQNIAFVGKTLGGKNIIVIMDNALCTSGLESNGENKKEGVGTYTFACHADLDSDLDTLPYHIYYPKTLA